ncbi:PaaX family transcriptional regulator C-terminal domain-containing protein [Streptomyces sp. NPDC001868]|uniref:PaaX family transcriptional regulator C-terminal domain-containing protein n=1 Tax=Streptomyces sp. NPDC001868 TaxID=3154401 RepID=UPI003318CBAB
MQTNVSGRPAELELRPLSARSVVLSLLLGMRPPELPVKDLVRHVEVFGVAGSTLRAALSRMVSAGDLRRADAVYRLSDRLLERRRRQDEAVHPETRPWDGDWEMAVVTATGRRPAERADLRTRLTALRLAELREGVWLRPANLHRTRPPGLDAAVQHFTCRPDQPTDGPTSGGPTAGELAARLWPLDAWAATSEALLAHIERTREPADRFTALAAAVRHLLADPVLPPELLPDRWPGPELRAAYTTYRRELVETVLGRAD